MDIFIETTVDLNKYKIFDVAKDGACLYRCMSRFIYDNYTKLQDIIERNEMRGISDIMEKEKDEEYTWELETAVSRELQKMLVKWLECNETYYVEEQNCNISELIQYCHEMTMEQYLELYKRFAGEDDFILIDTGNQYKRGKKRGQPKYDKLNIPTRWGALPEELAFCKLFDVCISIYTLRKYDCKTEKIVKTTSFNESPRFSLLATIGEGGYINADFLLLEEKANHYMYLREISF